MGNGNKVVIPAILLVALGFVFVNKKNNHLPADFRDAVASTEFETIIPAFDKKSEANIPVPQKVAVSAKGVEKAMGANGFLRSCDKNADPACLSYYEQLEARYQKIENAAADKQAKGEEYSDLFIPFYLPSGFHAIAPDSKNGVDKMLIEEALLFAERDALGEDYDSGMGYGSEWDVRHAEAYIFTKTSGAAAKGKVKIFAKSKSKVMAGTPGSHDQAGGPLFDNPGTAGKQARTFQTTVAVKSEAASFKMMITSIGMDGVPTITNEVSNPNDVKIVKAGGSSGLNLPGGPRVFIFKGKAANGEDMMGYIYYRFLK